VAIDTYRPRICKLVVTTFVNLLSTLHQFPNDGCVTIHHLHVMFCKTPASEMIHGGIMACTNPNPRPASAIIPLTARARSTSALIESMVLARILTVRKGMQAVTFSDASSCKRADF
jgi:hypothetical protein